MLAAAAAAGLLQLVVVDILLTRSVQVGQQPCRVLKKVGKL